MPEFGPNGTVIREATTGPRGYGDSTERPKVRRVLLATFLCGVCASITVALIAALMAFIFTSALGVLGLQVSQLGDDGGFLAGSILAVMMAAFNWYLFFIVVPVTWVVLLLSIGLFPRRGITQSQPYYRWGGIWGLLLVGGTTGAFGLAMHNGAALGAFLTGSFIGGLAGLACASLFLAIVRPQQQVRDIATDVF